MEREKRMHLWLAVHPATSSRSVQIRLEESLWLTHVLPTPDPLQVLTQKGTRRVSLRMLLVHARGQAFLNAGTTGLGRGYTFTQQLPLRLPETSVMRPPEVGLFFGVWPPGHAQPTRSRKDIFLRMIRSS